MKRSTINGAIKRMEQFIEEKGISLPPFAGWTPEDWADKGAEYDEIRDARLGWDITDYGTGTFDKIGNAILTIRNGCYGDSRYPKTYGEKLLLRYEGQTSPIHFHWRKMEDIINRGNGIMICRLYNATEENTLADTDVEIHKDGRRFYVGAGEDVLLYPGESITIYPRCFHQFFIQEGSGDVLFSEISMCSDDKTDNYFLNNEKRFPQIDEDEPAHRLLCTEYPAAK